MEGLDWKKAAAVTVTLVGGAVGIYWVGRHLLLLLLPFFIALALSLITRPPVLLLARRMPEKWAAVLVTALALLSLGALGYLLFSRLFLELRELISFLARDSEDPNGHIAALIGFLKGLRERLPLLGSGGPWGELLDVEGIVSEQLTNAVGHLSQRVTDLAVGIAGALPSVLLFLLVSMISCFYFAVEYRTVGRTLTALIPPRFRVMDWRRQAGVALRRYIRAYFLLFLLTAGELLAGFLLLRVRYAFLLALITAILDILPVLGVGTVLIPYAVLSFVLGNTGLGIGLLVLYAVITVVRQITEPRLVGKSLGLHPILMLISFYAGFKLFGVAGVFVGPLLAMLIKAFRDRGERRT